MARMTPGSPDLAQKRAEASFTAVDQATPWVEMTGPFLMLARGGAGNVRLEMSVDGGTTPIICQMPSGANNEWPVPVNQIVPNLPNETGLLFRLYCSAFTSGPIAARLSAGANA